MNCDLCQNHTLRSGSRKIPSTYVRFVQLRYHLRTFGFVRSCQRVFREIGLTVDHKILGNKKKTKAAAPLCSTEDVLNLKPGDWVEVKSAEMIRQTLDANNEHRGLDFTDEMFEYCGRRFPVFRRVERICMEGRAGEMRTLKNTVSLEGVVCTGGSRGCDRASFFFWREAWLKRVE